MRCNVRLDVDPDQLVLTLRSTSLPLPTCCRRPNASIMTSIRRLFARSLSPSVTRNLAKTSVLGNVAEDFNQEWQNSMDEAALHLSATRGDARQKTREAPQDHRVLWTGLIGEAVGCVRMDVRSKAWSLSTAGRKQRDAGNNMVWCE